MYWGVNSNIKQACLSSILFHSWILNNVINTIQILQKLVITLTGSLFFSWKDWKKNYYLAQITYLRAHQNWLHPNKKLKFLFYFIWEVCDDDNNSKSMRNICMFDTILFLHFWLKIWRLLWRLVATWHAINDAIFSRSLCFCAFDDVEKRKKNYWDKERTNYVTNLPGSWSDAVEYS
jgi:hypothetical protein